MNTSSRSRTSDDREEVAKTLTKYDFLALPVVDSEDRLVGIVTVDDALDVISEETEEDFAKMAGMSPSEAPYLKTPAAAALPRAHPVAAPAHGVGDLHRHDHLRV